MTTSNGSVILDSPEKPIISQSSSTTTPSPHLHSLFLGHIYSYPTVNAALDYASHFPMVQKITSTATPYYNTIKERSKPLTDPVLKRATPVLAKADALGDKILTRVDSKFPLLKKATPDDAIDIARKPYDTVVSTAEAYSTAAQDRLNVNVVMPLKKAGDKVKSHYTTVYDISGKTMFKNQVDPIIHPLNDRIEVIIKHYLPQGPPEINDHSNDDGSSQTSSSTTTESELARTLHLAQVAIQRAKPVIDHQATQVAAIPAATRAHVQEVYESKLNSFGKDRHISGPVYASLATWKQLSSESVSFATSALSTQVIYLKETIRDGASRKSNSTASIASIEGNNAQDGSTSLSEEDDSTAAPSTVPAVSTATTATSTITAPGGVTRANGSSSNNKNSDSTAAAATATAESTPLEVAASA